MGMFRPKNVLYQNSGWFAKNAHATNIRDLGVAVNRPKLESPKTISTTPRNAAVRHRRGASAAPPGRGGSRARARQVILGKGYK